MERLGVPDVESMVAHVVDQEASMYACWSRVPCLCHGGVASLMNVWQIQAVCVCAKLESRH